MDIYEFYLKKRKKENVLKRGLNYCKECVNNPISWIIAPWLIGITHILNQFYNLSYQIAESPESLLMYETYFKSLTSPENISGIAGLIFGKRIWNLIRGRKNV